MSLRAVIALQDTRTLGLVALVDQETGVRGYVATRNPLFLDVYRRGVSRYVLATKRFDNSASVDPSSLSAYSDVLNNSSLIEHFLKNEIELTQTGHTLLAAKSLSDGKTLFDRFRASDSRLDLAIRLRLAQDRELFQRTLDWARCGIWIAGGFSLALGIILGALVRASRHIESQAQLDALTGLANRRVFGERLDRREKCAGVMLLDLDEFKHVNDHYGHEVGDILLRAVARRLQVTVREGDLVARIGGDEFAIIFDSNDANVLVTRIRAAFDEPFNLPGELLCLSVGCSLGVCVAFSGMSGTDLVRTADECMFADKRARRDLAAPLPCQSTRRASITRRRFDSPVDP